MPLRDSKKRKISDHFVVPSLSPTASSSPSQAVVPSPSPDGPSSSGPAAVPSPSPVASSSLSPAAVPSPSHAASSSAFVNNLNTLADDVAILNTEMKVIQEKQDLLLRVITSSDANILAKLYELEGMVSRGQRRVQFAQEMEEEEEKAVEEGENKEEGKVVEEEEKDKEDEKVVEEEEKDKEDEKVVEEEEDKEEEKVVEEEEKEKKKEDEKEKEMEKEDKMHEKVAAEEEGKVDELTPAHFVGMQFRRKRRSKKPKNLRTSPTHPASS